MLTVRNKAVRGVAMSLWVTAPHSSHRSRHNSALAEL